MMHDHRNFTANAASAASQAYRLDDADKIRNFTGLVRKLAWHMSGSSGPSIDIDDLMQIGMIALMDCVQRHDRPTDDGFAAYAKLRIRGAMIDAMRKANSGSRNGAGARNRLDRALTSLRQRLGRIPTDGELADAMGLSATELAQLRLRATPVRQTDLAECYDDNNLAFATDEPDPETWLIQSEDRGQLADAIANLPERLQLVVQLYFLEELNLAEIAAVLEVSIPRVHQLKATAIGKIRQAMEATN